MIVILILIPLSVVIAGGFLWAFFWAVRSGQYDDTTTPSLRVLTEDGSRSPEVGPVSKNEPQHH